MHFRSWITALAAVPIMGPSLIRSAGGSVRSPPRRRRAKVRPAVSASPARSRPAERARPSTSGLPRTWPALERMVVHVLRPQFRRVAADVAQVAELRLLGRADLLR